MRIQGETMYFLRRAVIYLIIPVLSVLSGCGDDPETPQEHDYFPLKKGIYQIYAVEETLYSEVDDPQTFMYELMTEVIDSFPNTEGGFSYVIHRSKRDTPADPWDYLDTWSVRKDDFRVVLTEGNTSFVKIAFPATMERKWDGNAFNNLEDDEYTIESSNSPCMIGDTVFDNCLVVNQNDNQDFIVYQDKRSEVFAAGIGLIKKDILQLRYCTSENCLGQQEILDGIIFAQDLKEYGVH